MSDQNSQKIEFSMLEKLLPIHIKTNQVPFLAGVPGIGKSATIKHLAKQFDTKVFVLSINNMATKEDLTGARMMKDDNAEYGASQVFFPTKVVQDAINYAKQNPNKPVILFLDEINRTNPDVTSAVMSIITERRIGDVKLNPNIRLIAAGNDEGNVNALDSASLSRMQIYHVEPDIETYFKNQPNLNPYIKKLLQKDPDLLIQTASIDELNSNDDDDDDDDEDSADSLLALDGESMKQITVPRTLSYLSDYLNQVGLDGKHIPKDINQYFDFLDPNNSPLKYVVNATIGNTETSDKLYDLIADSLNTLNATGTNNQKASVKLPIPNLDILDFVKNAESDDQVSELFNDQYSKEDLTNTFVTLIQTDTYKHITHPEAVKSYYEHLNHLISDDNNLRTIVIRSFNSLLVNDELAQPVLDFVKSSHATDLDQELNLIISINA